MTNLPLAAPETDPRTGTPIFLPSLVLDVELAGPLPALSAVNPETQVRYHQARALIRLHTYPIGELHLRLDDETLGPEQLAAEIWQAMGDKIVVHLRADGLPPVTRLDAHGLPAEPAPACTERRRRFLADAPFATIVLATRDRADQLAKCLPSLLQLEYPRYEIIVVDNAPKTGATAALIAERFGDASNLRYVREDHPGLSWARDCGLKYAQGEIIAFIDDDEPADRYWLAELARNLQSDPAVACVTGLTLPAELETAAQAFMEEFGGFLKGRGFERLMFDLKQHRLAHPLYPYLASMFGSGGNMSYKTAVLRALGGFDPALGTGTPAGGAEELDVFFRLIMAGHALVFEPGAILRHFHRREGAGLRKQLYGYGVAFTAYLAKNVAAHPGRLLHLLGQTPLAIRYLFSPASDRNRNKAAHYPKDLTRAELWGMVCGPFAYAKSVRKQRLVARALGPLDLGPLDLGPLDLGPR